MKMWLRDMVKHEPNDAMVEGFNACILTFDGPKPAVDIEQLIVDAKNAILIVESGNARQTSKLCFKLVAMQRTLRKWRDIQ